MKLKKTLILLAATATGVGALATAPVISAAEYSSSFSGNVRVEALSTTSKSGDADPVEKLTTAFGGDEEESSTGGDTFLQWNHAYEGDNSAASGFIRFAGDGNVRINVEGSSELGNYKGDIKAEWERNGFGGVACDAGVCESTISERDQFAKLTHTGSGVYYKIGREEWLGNQKGYASDFGSYTKGYADAGFGSTRFSAHALGWAGNGVNVALLIQRDNGGSSSGTPYGIGTDDNGDTAAVSTFGLLVGYNSGPVDVAFNFGSGSTSDDDQTDAVSITELQLALTFGNVRPFLNFGSRAVTDEANGGAETSKISQSGWNIGVDVGLGASDLVIAYGSSAFEDTEITIADFTAGVEDDPLTTDVDETVAEVNPNGEVSRSGFDLIWATNQDPLKVSLVYASNSGTDTKANGDESDESESVYGVRLDFGF
ncbi:MAG: hypothetical protein K0U41_05760 [Gammaproteobacteria bacterium]|nr:hypothetical protein [Gammaproteobacteria bacterium]